MQGEINGVSGLRGRMARGVACVLLLSLGVAMYGEPQDKAGVHRGKCTPDPPPSW